MIIGVLCCVQYMQKEMNCTVELMIKAYGSLSPDLGKYRVFTGIPLKNCPGYRYTVKQKAVCNTDIQLESGHWYTGMNNNLLYRYTVKKTVSKNL